MQTVADIKCRLQQASKEEFAVLERSLCADTRKGVQSALASVRRRLAEEEALKQHTEYLYRNEKQIAENRLVVGLDEVGRGPLAGPLAVGAVVLPEDPFIMGLDDSKKLTASQREDIAKEIKKYALAWAVEYIEPEEIDAAGMALCLRMAFSRAVRAIEARSLIPEVILLDGNPLHLDKREINVVKGDSLCASIAAASIVAKVDRDELMCRYAQEYPQYGFERCKGYASAEHMNAIKTHGLSPLHRKTFCTSLVQETLF